MINYNELKLTYDTYEKVEINSKQNEKQKWFVFSFIRLFRRLTTYLMNKFFHIYR